MVVCPARQIFFHVDNLLIFKQNNTIRELAHGLHYFVELRKIVKTAEAELGL